MKKKLCVLLLMILFTTIFPLSALADDAPTVTLQIDDVHVYDGMNKSYQDGYSPTVASGNATIILPIIVNGGVLAADGINATPNLGDTSTSPFVFNNYQKTVNLQNNAVKGGGTISSYLVRFDLTLKTGRVNGVYPVAIDIKALISGGAQIDQSFTTYVIITDGKNPEAASATPAPVHQPKIIVSDYSINPNPVVAGVEFTASITLENTSASRAVYDASVTVSCDSANLALQNDSSTIYIGKIAKGGTADVELNYKTDLGTPAQRYNITLAIEYDNSEAQTLNSTGAIQVEISQPMNVVMDKPKVPEEVNAGDTMPLSIQVMNMGRSKVYNARCELTAPGLIPTETAFIGNIEAGTAAQGKMDVFVGTKDMTEGYAGDDKYGPTNGKITLTYEDENGKQYTIDNDINTTIKEPVIEPTSAQTEVKPDKESQWWISLIIAGAVIAIIAAILISRGKRKHHEDI